MNVPCPVSSAGSSVRSTLSPINPIRGPLLLRLVLRYVLRHVTAWALSSCTPTPEHLDSGHDPDRTGTAEG